MAGTCRRRRRGIAVVAVVLALAGCSGGPPAGRPTRVSSGAASSRAAAVAPAVVVTPANGARGVSVQPAAILVRATRGTLRSVRLTNPAGRVVSGALSADAATWRPTEPLGYGRTYTLTAVAASGDRTAEATSTFTTVQPANYTLPYLTPSANGVFGVGQPIVVRFDEHIRDRAAAVRALSVTTTPAQTGAWHWFGDMEVHWRPRQYWQPGTRVTVKADVYGVNFGQGLYGQADRAVSFTIGPSRIAIADARTRTMQVYIGGALVKTFPVSMGKGGTIVGSNGQTIDFWTRTGPHVVLDKEMTVRMTSASYGVPKTDPNYYDELVHYAVRISDGGEYVHLRDWRLWNLGKVNDSHGCVNVGPGNAQWFYNTFGPGDIVETRGTPVRLDPRDGLGDWTISWSDWAAS